jgi:hypothetical protein
MVAVIKISMEIIDSMGIKMKILKKLTFKNIKKMVYIKLK